MIKRYYLFFVAFIFLLRFASYSQISTSTLTGCAPLVGVTFTYTPAGTNPLWDFGDGSTSSLQNPTHTFSTKGTYIVKYTANGVSVQTTTITVYGKPSPSFTVTSPTEGCIPYTVSFQDHSTSSGGATITQWTWDFGDGGFSSNNSSSQTYIYSVGGQFNVDIKITDSNGCDSSLTIPNLVTVSQKPTVSLVTNPSPPSACTPPLTVTFTSSGSTSHSPIGSTLTYSWTFNGGGSSTLATPPPQTYTALGTYPVTVVVTDANNCSNTATTTVNLQSPTATFTTNDTVCLHASFNSFGSSPGGITWNYGDGTTGVGAIGTHTYATSGVYQVKLTVTSGSCSSVDTKTVYVQAPSANFSVTAPYLFCKLPATVSVVNNSTPSSGTTYQWAYYENFTQDSVAPTSYTLTSPSPTFTLSYLDTNQYTINTLDIMDSVSLWITTAQGCRDHKSFILIDTVFLPTARFMPDKYEGCVPLTVSFSDSSSTGPRNQITYWKYNFGDGTSTTINSSPGNTVHTYTAVGIYYPYLIIHTQNGCPDTSYEIEIEVGKPPVANFTVSPSPVCIGANVQLTGTPSTPANPIDSWHYYGDGGYYVSSCSDNGNVSSPFTHATGTQTISMVACYRGCCSTSTNTITVNGPLATFSVAMDCDSSHVFNFTGNISDATNWTWDFGDGNVVPSTTAMNISHTYSATGDYNVILTAFNSGNGCNPSADTIKIHVRDIKANFTYDALVCSKTPHIFDASTSTDVYTDPHNGYIWIWGDGTHPDITGNSSISHTFSTSGVDTVRLIVKDINGCTDTLKKIIKAFSTVASFTTNTIMCANSTITFTNTSTSDTTIASSTGYSWNFGDGSALSTQQNPTHTYTISNTSINTITVTLIVTNTLSCSDTARRIISISRPNAIFHPTSSINICAGSAVNFASTNSYPNMTWNYGDGVTLGPTPPTTTTSHSYTTSGSYSVTLTVVDAVGCTDVKSYNQLINVQNIPQVYITSPAFNNPNLCYPYQAIFTDSSVVNVFASRTWNTYDGTVYAGISPIGHLYPTRGTFSVTLTETTTNGCTATLTKTIKINGPLADFSVSPDTICRDQSITFTIKDTSDVSTWHWDFGDGKDTIALSPISHKYNFHPPNGTTNVQLIYWSKDSSCAQSMPHQISIRQVVANFNINHNPELFSTDTAHCLGTRDTFINISTGASTYGWSYGDGSAINSTTVSPAHTYTTAGTYHVELYIKDNVAGCVDTMIKKLIIYPSFTVSATGDTICQGNIAHLNASAANNYTWTPLSGIPVSSPSIANPTTTPIVTASYSLMASDINGCKDSVAPVIVLVIQKPDTVEDVHTIVIGQTYTLPGLPTNSVTAGYTYTWSPIDNLSCTSCPTPVFNGTVDAHYVETITDARGCFTVHSTFDIHVEPLASIDVPTAFTPNGDGTNDIVYVAGWGIKSLQYFKIYNRWGELVFESNDIKVGWDGTYRGTPQNMETYVYQVSAITYISQEPITKKGYIKLLR